MCMDAINGFLSIPLVTFVGGILVSTFLYWLARRDSRREAKELRRLNVMMMNAMEAMGWVKWVRDEEGNPTGRVVGASLTIGGRSSVTPTPTGINEPETRGDQDTSPTREPPDRE
jgi:hypothetical protein